MFEEEKEEWTKFFDFYKTKFGEEVGVMPGVFENDDFELDLFVGDETGEIRGIRVLQAVPFEDDGENDEEDDEEDEDLAVDEEDDEEDEDEVFEIYSYDFVANSALKPSDLAGEPYFSLEFNSGGEENEDEEPNDDSAEKVDVEVEESNDGITDEDINEEGNGTFKIVIYGINENSEEEHDGEKEIKKEVGKEGDEETISTPVEITGAVMINLNDESDIMVYTEDPALETLDEE
ncbi:MAG: hypothetical protein ACTSWL_06075 [Promethearchaeota archaeon]